ncbi:Uncharacterised protein [Mycobacteroides abscessus subsp. abscessus]|nr:Uncharacterised protein [Mycobacteroides abscessus subsp. abscessus]
MQPGHGNTFWGIERDFVFRPPDFDDGVADRIRRQSRYRSSNSRYCGLVSDEEIPVSGW